MPGSPENRTGSNREAGFRFWRGAQTPKWYLGTLLLVPIAILAFGSHWTWQRSTVVATARIVHSSESASEVPLAFLPERSRWNLGVILPPGSFLEIGHSRAPRRFSLALQADSDDSYLVSWSSDGAEFQQLWTVARVRGRGLVTRKSPRLETPTPARWLRVEPQRGVKSFSVAGLRVDEEPIRFAHALLIPVLWGLWAAFGLARRWPRLARLAEASLAWWRRADPWLAGALVYLVCFRVSPEQLTFVLSLLVVAALVQLLRRRPVATLAAAALLAVSVIVALQVATKVGVARIAQLHELTVDHRMRPDGKEINSDGVRFRGEAADLGSGDFVILFLGDSYTFGNGLTYEQAYPYQVEQLLAAAGCQGVRSVNFGWTSSSPLLGLRLLREVGYKYQPDLVLYSLDMTDFHDDLEYEVALRKGGDLEVSPFAILDRLPWPDLQLGGAFRELRRPRPAADEAAAEAGMPAERFFVTDRSLEETRPWIERGVIKNLHEMHRFSTRTLGSPMALVIYPRAYQYSSRESPRNWERREYEILGPYSKEPFRYFEERRERLPYPLLNLLPAFESSEQFPLFLEADPHWNEAGAALAARTVAELVQQQGLVLCGTDDRPAAG